jgi:hypothetical protein
MRHLKTTKVRPMIAPFHGFFKIFGSFYAFFSDFPGVSILTIGMFQCILELYVKGFPEGSRVSKGIH